MRRIRAEETKSLPITQEMVKSAYKKVKANQGSSGVDKVSLEEFQLDLRNNLYKLWNRLASGSYFPESVREVLIPKANGKQRKLGIPTVADRIAQQVLKSYLEPRLEKEFHENSYGYRPLKSAHQAVEEVRKNVRKYGWVLDMDIKSFFDEVNHELLMKALERHVAEPWVKMYIKRWLEAPVKGVDNQIYTKEGKGTPQGEVISPLLANLYLHYTLDKWLEIYCEGVPFVRYADDVIVHCHSEKQAKFVLKLIRKRLQDCSLRLNEEKTKVVYCENFLREKKDYCKKFDFLGFRFEPRTGKSSKGLMQVYDCAISPPSTQRIIRKWKELKVRRWTTTSLQEIAKELNPILRGICKYYGKFRMWELGKVFRRLHFRLVKWFVNKYKRTNKSYKKGYEWLQRVRKSYPYLFYHWSIGIRVT
jgi:group II intron reverse transcriptase/maturase